MKNIQEKWEFHWKREYSLFYGIAVTYSLIDFIKEELNKNIEIHCEGEKGWYAVYSTPWKNVLYKKIVSDFKNNLSYVKKKNDEIHESGQRFASFTKSLKENEKSSLEELVKLYIKYFDLLREYGNPLWRSFYYADAVLEPIEEILSNHFGGKDISKKIDEYSIPSKKASIFLISEFFRKEHNRKKRIKFVGSKMPWIGSTDPFRTPFNKKQIEFFADSFQVVEKKKKPDISFFNSKEKQLIKIYQEFLFLKDKRDDYRRQAYYYAFPFVKLIAKKLNISLNDLSYLSPEGLSLKDIKKEIKRRKQAYLVKHKNNKLKIISGKNAKNLFISLDIKKDIKEIKGTVSSNGNIEGKIRVVKSEKDLRRVEKNEIMVAITTNPTYVTAMQKAAAFITDEGGLTCHAAIVAREMKKPCIVGTKIATEVLKDGDLVKIDTNKGIVRILKRA